MTIDPTLEYCNCGLTWRPKLYHKILMLVFGEYTRTCPRCGTRLTFKLANHVVKIRTETIKDKEEVYKNG